MDGGGRRWAVTGIVAVLLLTGIPPLVAAPGVAPRPPKSGGRVESGAASEECGVPPDDDGDGGPGPGPGPGPIPDPDPWPLGFGEVTEAGDEQPGFVEGQDAYFYTQSTGTYVFPKASPHLLELRGLSGEALLTNGTFALESSPSTAIEDPRVLSAGPSLFWVETNVTADAVVVGTIRVEYGFSGALEPKIAATFNASQGANLSWFRVVWNVHTSDDYLQLSGGGGTTYLPSLMSPTMLSGAEVALQVGETDTPPGWRRKAIANWSDFGPAEVWGGPVSAGGMAASQGFQVKFPLSVSQVDPTLIARDVSGYATSHNTQRKVFYQDGYYWFFYYDGQSIVYRRSVGPTSEGQSWSQPYRVFSGALDVQQGWFDVAHSGRRVVVAWGFVPRDRQDLWSIRIRSANTESEGLAWDMGGPAGHVSIDPIDSWSGTATIPLSDLAEFLSPISAAVGVDADWVVAAMALTTGTSVVRVYRSPSGLGTFTLVGEFQLLSPWRHAVQILPLADGRTSVVYVREGSGKLYGEFHDGVTWSQHVEQDIAYRGSFPWAAPPNHPEWYFSAATDGANIHVAYVRADASLGYARWTPPEPTVANEPVPGSGTSMFPSISVDRSGGLYITWRRLDHRIDIVRNPMGQLGFWTLPEVAFQTNTFVAHVSTPAVSSHRLAVVWTSVESDTPSVTGNLWLGTLPLVVPAPVEGIVPWQRDGLSPYGYQFNRLGTSVAPATGQLAMRQVDFSLPGRGLDLIIARLYAPPRYLVEGSTPGVYDPYLYEENPAYDLGDSWTLDFPWLGRLGVHWWGGQVFLYAFNSDGEFVVHEAGVHFTLRKIFDGTYELRDASGLLYRFDVASGAPPRVYALMSIEDASSNTLAFEYHTAGGRLDWIWDATEQRRIRFDFETSPQLGKLESLTLQTTDGFEQVVVDYVFVGEELRQVVIPGGPTSHVTSYQYTYQDREGSTTSSRPFLERVTFPTQGAMRFEYVAWDVTTDARSFYVALQEVLDSPGQGGGRISKTTFHYRLVDGASAYTDVYQYDDTALRLHTSMSFGSPRRPYVVLRYQAPDGTTLRTVRNWHAPTGEISVQEVFDGDGSQLRPRYRVESAFDEWGNLVYSRDAVGKESVFSYANTRGQNGFRIPGRLEETADSRLPLLYDDFSDREIVEWTTAGDVDLDYSRFVDDPPALAVSPLSDGTTSFARRDFGPAQTNMQEFMIRFSLSQQQPVVLIHLDDPSGQPIALFLVDNRALYGWDADPGTWRVLFTELESERWYRLAGRIHRWTTSPPDPGPLDGRYSAYLNGRLLTYESGSSLDVEPGIGHVASITVSAGGAPGVPSSLWVQDVTVADAWDVTVNGVPSDALVLFVSPRGKVIGVRRGPGTVAMEPGWSPLISILVVSGEGRVDYASPVRWMFPGFRLAYTAPVATSSVSRVSSGFGLARDVLLSEEGDIPPEDWNSGGLNDETTTIESWDWSDWDPPGAVHLQDYHRSPPLPGAHHHYFATSSRSVTPQGTPNPEYLVQYVMPLLRSGYAGFQVKTGSSWYGFSWGHTERASILLMADNPPPRGIWNQLLVRCDAFGLCGSAISGWSYELFDGAAMWDLSGVADGNAGAVRVQVGSGHRVSFLDENRQEVTYADSNGMEARLDLYDNGITAFPTKGYLRIEQYPAGALVYESPLLYPIWGGDVYAFTGTDVYANDVDPDVHDRLTGARTWRHDRIAADEATTYVRYDAFGRPRETRTTKDGGWIMDALEYDSYGNPSLYRDPRGRETTFVFGNSPTDCWGAYLTLIEGWIDGQYVRTRYRWDCTWGRLVAETTPENEPFNNPTEYFYDGFGRLDLVREPDVYGIRHEVDYVYEDDLNRIKVEDEDGRWTQTVYDGIGRDVRVRRLATDGSTLLSEASYSYDHVDSVREYVDFEGNRYQVLRDPLGRPLSIIYPGGVAAHFEHMDAENRVTARDPSGVRVDRYFDDAGRLVKAVEYPDGSTPVPTFYTYDRSGNLLTAKDPLGAITTRNYDRLGRLRQTNFPDGKTETYDYLDDGALESWVRRDSVELTYAYDLLGRLDTVSKAGSALLDYDYDRNDNVVRLDRGGVVLTYDYDSRDRLEVESLSLPGSTTFFASIQYFGSGLVDRINYGWNYYVDYGYDAEGRTSTVTWGDGMNQDSVSIGHDRNGDVTDLTHGSGEGALRARYARDDRGQVTDIQVYHGQITATRESLNPQSDVRAMWSQCPDDGAAHFTKVDDPEGEGDGDETFIYTSNEQWKDEYALADLRDLQPGEGIRWVEVVAVARLATKESTDVRLRLLVNGEPHPSDPADGFILTSKYAPYRLRFTAQPDGSDWTKAAVDALTAGVEAYLGLNAKGQIRVTKLYVTVTIDGTATSYYMNLHYDYRANGQVRTVEDVLRGTIEDYGYDGAGRLTDVQGRWDLEYVYDHAGNRKELRDGCRTGSCVVTTYDYPTGAYNRLSSYGPSAGPRTTFDYFDTGNVWKRTHPSGDVWGFAYDDLGSLTQATLGSSSSVYAYDGLGNRVVVEEGGNRRESFYLGSALLYEFVPSTGWKRLHVYADGMRLATLGTEGTDFHFADILGSTRLVLHHESGAYTIAYEAAWKPFGIEVPLMGENSFKYLGTERPDQAGLYRFGLRSYDPEIGRFYELDPVFGIKAAPQSLNRYAYAGNDPVGSSDPAGAVVPIIAALFWIGYTALAAGTIAVTYYHFATPAEQRTSEGYWNAFWHGSVAGAIFAASFVLMCPGCFGFAGFAAPGMGTVLGASFVAGVAEYTGMRLYESGGDVGAIQWRLEEAIFSGIVAAGTTSFFLGARYLYGRARLGSNPWAPTADGRGGQAHAVGPRGHMPGADREVIRLAAMPMARTPNFAHPGSLHWGRTQGSPSFAVVRSVGFRQGIVTMRHGLEGIFIGHAGSYPIYAMVSGWRDYL